MVQSGPNEAQAEGKSWLMPDADFERLKGLFYQYVALRCSGFSPGASEGGDKARDELEKVPDELFNGDSVKLKELYSRLLADALSNFIQVLKSDDLKLAVDTVLKNESVAGPEFAEKNALADQYFHRLSSAIYNLAFLGFDRYEGELEESPFHPPFHKINVRDPDWQMFMQVSENFCHAMKFLFNPEPLWDSHSLLEAGGKCDEVSNNFLKQQIDLIPCLVSIFTAWKDRLLGNENESQVPMGGVAGDLLGKLAKFRFLMQTRRNPINLPMETRVKPGLNLESGDANNLLIALFEVAKNTFRHGKVESDNVYRGYVERGEPYTTVSADEVEFQGRKYIAIEIRDKGRWIDLNQIMKTLVGGDYGFRDYTVAELLDVLSQRHVSIPLEEGGAMSTGIGLHSAHGILRAHNGSMFYTNIRSGGVGCLILIPAEGKASKHDVEGAGLKGKDLDVIAGQLGKSQFFDDEIGERMKGYSETDANVKNALLQMKMAVDAQQEAVRNGCAGVVGDDVQCAPLFGGVGSLKERDFSGAGNSGAASAVGYFPVMNDGAGCNFKGEEYLQS